MKANSKVAVMGTGMVGRTVAEKLAALGHRVTIGTRDPVKTLARTEKDGMGNPPFREWREGHKNIELATLEQAAAQADVIVNATAGGGSLEALSAAGASNLAGKLLIDIANPLDFSGGMPPSLSVCNTDSLGEQIQKAFPEAKVVKTLNTMNAHLMVAPDSLAGGDHTVFVSGNDAGAKETVTALLRSIGWKDILDLGDITTARGTEMMLPIWVRIWAATKNPAFSFKVVR